MCFDLEIPEVKKQLTTWHPADVQLAIILSGLKLKSTTVSLLHLAWFRGTPCLSIWVTSKETVLIVCIKRSNPMIGYMNLSMFGDLI